MKNGNHDQMIEKERKERKMRRQHSRESASLGLAVLLGLLIFASAKVQATHDECEVAVGGSVFLTGLDSDFHAFGGNNFTGARNINTIAISFITNPDFNTFKEGGVNKFLFVQSNIVPPSGHLNGFNGIVLDFTDGVDFEQHGASTLNAELDKLGTKYNAICVTSDFGGILTQDELDILNARFLDIIKFLNAGGGLYAMAESNLGAGLTPDGGHYGFLPFVVSSTTLDQPEFDNTLTPFGESLGLTNDDINGNFSHAFFTAESGMQIVDVDPAGNILTLAGRGIIDPEIGLLPDCNENCIPDACDIDPTDPDGDGHVSPDSNNNGIPDECEQAIPTVSGWGMIVLALLLLTGIKIKFGGRRSAQT